MEVPEPITQFRYDAGEQANQAAPQRAKAALLGTWKGTYACNQGMNGLTLTIDGQPEKLTAVFDFYPVGVESARSIG